MFFLQRGPLLTRCPVHVHRLNCLSAAPDRASRIQFWGWKMLVFFLKFDNAARDNEPVIINLGVSVIVIVAGMVVAAKE